MYFIFVNMQKNQRLWKRTFLEVWHKHRKYPFVKWQMINWLRFLQFTRYFIVHLFFSSDLLCSSWSCNTERGALVISYWVECQQLLQFNLKVAEELIYHLFWLASLYHLLLIGPKRQPNRYNRINKTCCILYKRATNWSPLWTYPEGLQSPRSIFQRYSQE